jgi:alkanesulfonate monooxygenase SsuD/methylene tetrahydromethanopterin reductase-like flavin-dependent oxidoreductase (luciferase family)
LHVASKTATLDVLSGGRVDVGVGRSGNPYQIAPFGVQLEDTRSIWEESLSMLSNIWTQPVYSHQGKYFNVPEREVIPKPFQKPHPPLWSACSQEDTSPRAGELGIGCLCNVLGQYDAVSRRIDVYKEALKTAQPVGRFINDKIVVSSIGFCDENKQRPRERGAEIASPSSSPPRAAPAAPAARPQPPVLAVPGGAGRRPTGQVRRGRGGPPARPGKAGARRAARAGGPTREGALA